MMMRMEISTHRCSLSLVRRGGTFVLLRPLSGSLGRLCSLLLQVHPF